MKETLVLEIHFLQGDNSIFFPLQQIKTECLIQAVYSRQHQEHSVPTAFPLLSANDKAKDSQYSHSDESSQLDVKKIKKYSNHYFHELIHPCSTECTFETLHSTPLSAEPAMPCGGSAGDVWNRLCPVQGSPNPYPKTPPAAPTSTPWPPPLSGITCITRL